MSAQIERCEFRDGTPVTVRLPEEQIMELMAFAWLDGDTLADQIRKATRMRLGSRLKDPTFPEQVEAARNREDQNPESPRI